MCVLIMTFSFVAAHLYFCLLCFMRSFCDCLSPPDCPPPSFLFGNCDFSTSGGQIDGNVGLIFWGGFFG